MDRSATPSTRRLVVALAVAQGAVFATLGLARYATFHNETFDLAFYTRIAWGLARNEFWEPMVNAHVYGLHLSPILVPLGALGALFDTASVLVVTQALALALAALPMARIGERHLGPAGALLGATLWLYYPNLGHVAGYEAHPGAMAALPLAWIAWAIDRGDARALALGVLGVLLCREDLALLCILAAAVFALRHPSRRRIAAIAAGISLAWALLFFVVLHPRYAPAQGSLELHFGRFGGSVGEVLVNVITHPQDLFAHLATPARLAYLPKVLAPLLFLPLMRPSWLVPALPIFAINLLSAWPTTTQLDVHYLTPALPFLVAGALEGAGRVATHARVARRAGLVIAAPAAAVLVAHALAGGTLLSRDHPAHAFVPDARSAAARAIVDAIPADASVQAPYAFLAHLAERRWLYRASSPEAGADYLVLDVAHRRRYAAREDLLRTVEEPIARDWLARDDHRLVLAAGDFLLLERGAHPRTGRGASAIVGRADPEAGQRIAACLSVLGGRLESDVLVLDLVARDACPSDLAIRIGPERRARRVDLLFGGWLSPRHLRRGDRLESRHRLGPALRARVAAEGLRIGALRQSGARPEHADPVSVRLW